MMMVQQLGFTYGNRRGGTKLAHVTDGTSNVIFLGEKHTPMNNQGANQLDYAVFSARYMQNQNRCLGLTCPLEVDPQADVRADYWPFGSMHGGSVNFAFVDGSVRSIGIEANLRVLGYLARKDDGNAVQPPN